MPSMPGVAQPGARAVAGVTWPPPPGQTPQEDDAATPPPAAAASPQATMSMDSAVSPGGLVHSGPSASELPRAPPGTPLNVNDVHPPTDISAIQDPARFGAVSSPEPVPLL